MIFCVGSLPSTHAPQNTFGVGKETILPEYLLKASLWLQDHADCGRTDVADGHLKRRDNSALLISHRRHTLTGASRADNGAGPWLRWLHPAS